MRRGGAPRLIEWTGERCVPWAPDIQVIYEHYHRYLWARALVADQRVLDLGSGEGFGAALLAGAAAHVVGVDIDARTVEHSQLNYASSNLEFCQGSVADLSEFEDGSLDVVVAFEVIEHTVQQAAMLAEVTRVLTSDGLLILSTPDRRSYSEATGQVNPFHERELSQDELVSLVRDHFSLLSLFGQRTATGSRIEALGPNQDSDLSFQIERAGDSWEEAGGLSPLYLVGVASNAALPPLPTSSTLSDFGIELLRQAERGADAVAQERDAARAELASTEARLHEAMDRDAEHQRDAERQEAVHQEVAQRLQAESEQMAGDLGQLARELAEERYQLDAAHAELARVEGSVTWRLFQRARSRLYGTIGYDTLAARSVHASLRAIGRATPAERSAGWRAITFPRFAAPTVSIVIPVHDGAPLTARCLSAIARASGGVDYEVVIVDDVADSDTRALLRAVKGARVIVNEQNLGFLRTVNRGAAEARGRYIVLLNNDTEPQPGWLEALVARAEAADDIGVVGAKLVFPDGTLQDAGGIVWRDGSPWNYGRGHDANAPEYNYVREVDYATAAASLVKADVWRAVGGFDERYAPIYFEDTDLCFAVRALGWRVMYEPRAVVVHVEGGSMGTDTSAGGKRSQQRNQPKFAAKWRQALTTQPSHPSHDRAYHASNHRRSPQVLVVDHRVPMPDCDSGSVRMWHILEGLLSLGCRVAFLPDGDEGLSNYGPSLEAMGVELLAGGGGNIEPRLASWGSRLELAVLSRPYVAARYLHLIRRHAPRARIAYDTVDLHFLREERAAQQLDGTGPQVAGAFRHLELALMRAADVTLVVSDEEARHLHTVAPDIELEIVPNANPVAEQVPGPERRSGLLFVGGFEHRPNVDAALYLASEVMPRVWRDLGDVLLTIVGSKAPPEVIALASPGIDVPGWVPDLEPLLRESLASVAPLRYGAGMKGKVTQSLAAGLPVVTTSIGAEGLGATDGVELLVADDPQELADRIVRLHHDHETWHSLSENGRELVERVCSPAVQVRSLKRLLERKTADTIASQLI